MERELSAEQVETIHILCNIHHMTPKHFPSDQVPNVFKVLLSSYQELRNFSVSMSRPTSLPHHISLQAASMVWDWHWKIMCCTVCITVTSSVLFMSSNTSTLNKYSPYICISSTWHRQNSIGISRNDMVHFCGSSLFPAQQLGFSKFKGSLCTAQASCWCTSECKRLDLTPTA